MKGESVGEQGNGKMKKPKNWRNNVIEFPSLLNVNNRKNFFCVLLIEFYTSRHKTQNEKNPQLQLSHIQFSGVNNFINYACCCVNKYLPRKKILNFILFGKEFLVSEPLNSRLS